ncbi:proteasome assembly chaperone 2 [Corythoichthys intestinalis]|uniref:proteasome assembly chaperone 2 n=1 Tax=Corythoichthys intestinalis TaxID=161448 RepID=UPI0025A4D57B|nr:proteasome assembly chaperone 2 [Corythoichthys intestinalis]XP_061808999.1 proteasome assembly chaperone 2-like [Nerophis lumbriciformis]
MFIASQNTTPAFKDLTLIMPAVAVGNVGQLAVDLLISTLNLPRVGYLHTDCLIPMAGNNPYATSQDDAGELHTAAEVYAAPELKIVVLQIRAPVVKTKSKRFRQLLLSWIKSNGFSRTLVLSSSHAYHRDDQQMQGTPLRYLVTPSLLKICGDAFKELGWKEMERVPVCPGRLERGTQEPRLYVPGGGITKSLYMDSCDEDVPLAVLLAFCSEGDNVPDALALVSHLDDWLHLLDNTNREAKWKIPTSWRLLFGSGIPPAIF